MFQCAVFTGVGRGLGLSRAFKMFSANKKRSLNVTLMLEIDSKLIAYIIISKRQKTSARFNLFPIDDKSKLIPRSYISIFLVNTYIM